MPEIKRRVSSIVAAGAAGAAGALWPWLASAADEGSRAIERSADWRTVVLVTVLTIAGLGLLATLGRLYQLQSGLHWPFQDEEHAGTDH